MSWSFWEKDFFHQPVDLLVIGAGIVGLNAALAYKKKHPDHNVLVMDRGVWPSGATTRNAGFACFGTAGEISADLKNQSRSSTLQLIEKRVLGLRALLDMHGAEALQFEACGGYEVFFQGEETVAEAVLNEVPRLNDMLAETGLFSSRVFTPCPPNPTTPWFPKAHALIFNPFEGALHSGLLWASLREKVQLAGIQMDMGWTVESINSDGDSTRVTLNHTKGRIERFARKVLVAVNGFAGSLLPELAEEVQPARGVVLVTQPLNKPLPVGTFHYAGGDTYFRKVGQNQLLIGGGRRLQPEIETTIEQSIPQEIKTYLMDFVSEKLLPNASWEVADIWAGTMGMGAHRAPVCKKIRPGVVAAVRLGGMGVALGTQLGQEAAELLD
jgi:gamma-glutamylputrescine oxidase